MGTLNTYPFFSRYQGAANDFIICIHAGTLIRSGVGQTFWFRSTGAALAQVPLIERGQAVLVKAVSSDQQDVNVRVSLTHRIADPLAAAQRFDFDLFPRSSSTEALGVRQVGELVARVARSVAIAQIATIALEEILNSGMDAVAEALNTATTGKERLAPAGVEICDACVLFVHPDEAVESALRAPLFGQLRSKADRALYEHRALTIEQERRIPKVELASKLEFERRRVDLVAQEGQNACRQAEEKAAADFVETNVSTERRNIPSATRAEEITRVGATKNEVEKVRLDTLTALGADVLKTLVLRGLTGDLPAVSQISITPDVFQRVLADLIKGGE